ncbi:hypothetical protein SVAN01_03832 [Stagonosporopsis vannaccii]|nr:hypothetical protein SVAN01_03832 [Stagonosporopsis vannaccii]
MLDNPLSLDTAAFLTTLYLRGGTTLVPIMASLITAPNFKKTFTEDTTPYSSRIGNGQCYITNLSTELVCHIIDFLPPESHLDFACTSKRIAYCSSNILKRHQEAYSKYRIASDISPATIPTLLRSAFGRADPILVWHVRSLEIWYDRTSWQDWKPLCSDQQLHEEPTNVDRIVWKWQEHEFEEYIEGIEDQFDTMIDNGDETIRTEAHEQFGDGLDGVLKMLLIAYCPRLRNIKFVSQKCHEKTTLGWLRRVIHGSNLYGSHWPPGLCSIREICVGVESDTWMSQAPRDDDLDPWGMSMHVFCSLLHLPRLISIYYNNLIRPDEEEDDDDATEWEEIMPFRSSTVKHIFLDDCSDMPRLFRDALPEVFTALQAFTLRAGMIDGERIEDADSLVKGLCSSQSGSLHTLMLYGPFTAHQIHGYRCSCYRNEELQDAHNLKTVAINISDVELDCQYSLSGDFGNLSEDEQRKYFVKWFRDKAFPGSLERLIFWGEVGYFSHDQDRGKYLDWLEDALIHVVESHRWLEGWDSADEEEIDKLSTTYESFYCHLKAVYLEDIERQYRYSNIRQEGPFSEKVYFQKLVEVGRQAGVEIHTLTSRAPRIHEHTFPTAPDKYDLQTGPWWEHRSKIEDWVFDVYKGRRVPPGCGKCGKCEQCLGQYSAELWQSLYT